MVRNQLGPSRHRCLEGASWGEKHWWVREKQHHHTLGFRTECLLDICVYSGVFSDLLALGHPQKTAAYQHNAFVLFEQMSHELDERIFDRIGRFLMKVYNVAFTFSAPQNSSFHITTQHS